MKLKMIVAVLGAVILVALVAGVQNTTVVPLRFLFWRTDVSLLQLLFGTSLAAMVVGFVGGSILTRRL